ncbi:hypothetical protein QVD17_17860 [Tagetes erecta]|uniref:Reverse transcriptase domain-containing protein n=1 Tax=Tagetes erecta TaxID=13708 RepID=A0AAD8KLL4_TARER|nr:hypothetical protein QVD17_17860 [Tagetes erecta]
MKDNGLKASKIDRVLVCNDFHDKWPEAILTAWPRYLSDHSPLTLVTSSVDLGPKPFRFFSSWLDMPGFNEVVTRALIKPIFASRPDSCLAAKLKNVKAALKVWIPQQKMIENELIHNNAIKLHTLDIIAELFGLTEEESKERMEIKKSLLDLERKKVVDLRQKSRVKWAIEGDENTTYFHGSINSRLSSNRINGIFSQGLWKSNPKDIKSEAFKFFENRFKESLPYRPNLCCTGINKLSNEDADLLVIPFSSLEIKRAAWDCGSDKAPGPDGFCFAFIKRFWELLEPDFVDILNNFYQDGGISNVCSSSFITLVPKIKDPTFFDEYRPISLIGCISKIISKVLANRMKPVMGKVILDSQTAFLANRSILEGPLVVNEVISWLKKSKLEGLIFKVDFNKAFDSVNWQFIDSILLQMNFPKRWRSWVMGILKSSKASVLINGSPTKEFYYSRGVRQGDPLSPFIFLVVMEAFNWVMNKASSIGLFRGIQLPNNGPKLSHFLFADDVIILGEWSKSNFMNLIRILRCFHLASGLEVNSNKSSLLGINIQTNLVESLASCVHCKVSSLPFSYLGIPVGANMNKIKNWDPVIDSFKSRLSLWKAKHLSIGGRLILIQSVLDSIPIYFFSLFKAPKKVIENLDKIRRNFLWGGNVDRKRVNWVKWEVVCSPKSSGGLGVGSLESLNLSLLAKWWWKFKTESHGLWKQAIESIHLTRRGNHFIPGRKDISGVWINIKRIESSLIKQNIDLSRLIVHSNNSWSWLGDPQGLFSVRSLRKLLYGNNYSASYKLKWCKSVPQKVNIFAWQAELDRIPTRQALSCRNINIESILCPLCSQFSETAEHLLISCEYANLIWCYISSWCNIPPIFAFSIRDLLDVFKFLQQNKAEAVQTIVMVALWSIWKMRNEVIFNNCNPSIKRLIEDIKILSFFWFKNRSKSNSLEWRDWCSFKL